MDKVDDNPEEGFEDEGEEKNPRVIEMTLGSSERVPMDTLPDLTFYNFLKPVFEKMSVEEFGAIVLGRRDEEEEEESEWEETSRG